MLNEEINDFLNNYPKFEEQSLNKKPNLKQLKEDGNVSLDCRYLNFAPQCEGWMQVTQNGGFGSFLINWSGVLKLTTAATIPYYTGQYANSKRGFGFVTIGASIDDFHAAANETKRNVSEILKNQTKSMEVIVNENQVEIEYFIQRLIKELSLVTLALILLIIYIAIWVSNYILSKINNLLVGTNKFANKEFDYRIKITSEDEIGNLEKSFNIADMIIVTAVLDIGNMMMEIAGLSFLGLGAEPPLTEWGLMVSQGRSFMQTAPWVVIAPGLAIFITVLVFNMLGDTLSDITGRQ